MVVRILSVVIIALMAMPLNAKTDTYAVLWQQVKNAQKKDLPATQLGILSRIADKASRERAYGHLMKAQMQAVFVKSAVSPDSLLPSIQRLETLERQASETDVVLAAVYQSVLGRLYRENPSCDDDAMQKSAAYYKKSLQHPDALAKAQSATYLPFVVKGVDSRIFNNDMLHVIGMECEDYATLHDYYLKAGNRAAACIMALEQARKEWQEGADGMTKKGYQKMIDSLSAVYFDLPEACELAIERYNQMMRYSPDVKVEDKIDFIDKALERWGTQPRMNELRNAKRQLSLPGFHVDLTTTVFAPGQPIRLKVSHARNINELRLTVRRLNLTGDTELDADLNSHYAKIKKLIVPGRPYTLTRHYDARPDYKINKDTIDMKGMPAGVYLLEISTDNVSVPVKRTLIRVSGLYVLTQKFPDKNMRLVVTDVMSGLPVPGAHVRLFKSSNRDNKESTWMLTCDDNGEVVFTCPERANVSYHAYTDTDKNYPKVRVFDYYTYVEQKNKKNCLGLYTDRSIYRPGQTVHVAALAYEYNPMDISSSALGRKALTLTLRDANNKEVASQKVVTDDYGMASADFVLPAGGLTGTYKVRSDAGIYATTYFSVEEYKRPTFIVEFDKVDEKYQAGDTVTVNGTASSYAGVAVQGGKVVYKVLRRRPWFWGKYVGRESDAVIASDTVVTGSDGKFAVRVPVSVPETSYSRIDRFYSFCVLADVTDMSGETRHGETVLPYSSRPAMFACEVPDIVNRDSVSNITFEYKNNAGENLSADVTYYIDDNKYSCKTNVSVKLPVQELPSSRHKLTAYCGNDTITKDFVTFSLNDGKLGHNTHDWFYVSSEEFPADGRPVYIQAGSSDSVLHVVYTIVSGNRIVEKGNVRIDDGRLLKRELVYKPEYGDGISLSFAWVKNGKAYRHTAMVKRPMPDTRLVLKWNTFRDRLIPGQNEEWILNVAYPDAKPATAQLMALLYDKSLDQIRKHKWTFSIPINLNIPYLSWKGRNSHASYLTSDLPFKALKENTMLFSHFDFLSVKRALYEHVVVTKEEASRVFDAKETFSAIVPQMRNAKGSVISDDDRIVMVGYASKQAEGATEETQEDAVEDVQPQLRENLAETAFFYPGLETDAGGNVNIKFTLPESVTTWRFIGLAHDKKMNNGLLESEIVAKKKVMIQPNMPRFVRVGDKTVISARIMNTSEKDVNGKAEMLLLNPETGKQVFRQVREYNIKANDTHVVRFDVDMSDIKNDGLLICRIIASGSDYSDGEQHYLPVLPEKELVTNTIPFTQDVPGTLTINLKNMFEVRDNKNRLTVEYTENPVWLMIQALPSVAWTDNDNAISLAAAYYANSIGRSIMHSSPIIKNTVQIWRKETGDATSLVSNLQKNEDLKSLVLADTPWLADANFETGQKQRLAEFFDESSMPYRLSDNISKLKKLQNEDGSFSWWPGMAGSRYMTQMIVEMMVRLNSMIGVQPETSALMTSAFKFLNKEAAKEVVELKKAEKENRNVNPSESVVDYLYICSVDGNKHPYVSKNDMEYLLNLLERQNTRLSIYGKARAAVIMGNNGRESKARELLKSIKEYTVYKENTGRYFDTPKALYSWFDYRIPSQVSAIEALKKLTPEDVKTVTEMQQWLLQSKRTQGWSTPVNSVNAVYAFLNGNMKQLSASDDKPAVLKLDGKELETSNATAGLGYVKALRTGDRMNKLTVEKTSKGVSWGAVYAQFMQPVADVKASSAGMTVMRDIIKNGKKITGKNSVDLNVGDKIIVRITLTADRDYDFVQVSDKRAACLEPVSQLSGYRSGYYCTPKDNVTNYYYDRLSKGKHVIETEYHVDRAGQYSTGTCTVQCAYSPEYSSRGAALMLETSN